MKEISFSVVNAFIDEQIQFSGNPAGVVFSRVNCYQEIAKQLNLVETVFIDSSEVADCRFKYFTPLKELPITGHPTLAAIWALKEKGLVRNQLTIETKGGIINAQIKDGKVWLTQKEPTFRLITQTRRFIAEVFNLPMDSLHKIFEPEAVNAGLGHLIIGVKTLSDLNRAAVKIEELHYLCQAFGAMEAQLFCITENDQIFTRNLCPRLGEEDPACGNGNAALGAYLAKYGILNLGETLNIHQGHTVGRPSIISVLREDKILIGGKARLMANGTMYIEE